MIKMKHSNEAMDCMQEVIAMKKARSTHFGWEDIVRALHAIQCNNLAERICKKYNISLPPSLLEKTEDDVVVLRLKESSESRLKGKFSALVTFAIRVLEKKGEQQFEDFKSYIVSYFSADRSVLEASNYRQVFDQISQENQWDFMHYSDLLEVLRHFISDEAEDKCCDYQHAVTAHYATGKLTETMSRKDLTKLCPAQENSSNLSVHELHMKLHPHKVSDRSLTYIHSIWDSMSDYFSIPSVKTIVDHMHMPPMDTEADTLCATMPSVASEPLMSQNKQSWKKFMEENNITEISFDTGHLYSLEQ
jgi:hypothetical protein